MKQLYIQPQTKVDFAECEEMLAGSILDINSDSQNITPSNDDDYDGEFSAKEYSFDW